MAQPEPCQPFGRDRGGACRRRGGRLPQESLCSSLGPILDLAPGGARILARSTPEGRVHLILEDHLGRVPVDAEVAWSKRRGFFKHEIGVRFVGLTPEKSAVIREMSMRCRYARYIHREEAA